MSMAHKTHVFDIRICKNVLIWCNKDDDDGDPPAAVTVAVAAVAAAAAADADADDGDDDAYDGDMLLLLPLLLLLLMMMMLKLYMHHWHLDIIYRSYNSLCDQTFIYTSDILFFHIRSLLSTDLRKLIHGTETMYFFFKEL